MTPMKILLMFVVLSFTAYTQVSVTPYFINFGEVNIGELKDTTLIVKSTESDLILESFNFEFGSDSYSISEQFPIHLLKNEERSILIRYIPTDSVKSFTQYTFQTKEEPLKLAFLGGYNYQDTIFNASEIFTPKEGDHYQYNNEIVINWTKVNNIERYVLEFTSDNGSRWTTVTDSAIGTSYSWKAPEVNSDKCKFRINPYVESEKNKLEMEWDKFIGVSRSDISKKLIQISDGGFIIVGTTNSKDSSADKQLYNDIFVVKTDINGNQIWSKTFGSKEGEDVAYSVIEAEDKTLMIIGATNSQDLGFDLKGKNDVLVMNLTADGTLIWMKNFGGTHDDEGGDIIQGENGNYYIVGYSESSDGDISTNEGKRDFLIMSIDDKGTLIWLKTYGFDFNENLFQIRKSVNGGFILLGNSNTTRIIYPEHKQIEGDNYCVILKISDEGLLEWESGYNGGDVNPYYLTETPNGDIFVTGFIVTTDGFSTNQKTWLLRLDKDGKEVWSNEYQGYYSYIPIGIKVKKNNEILLLCLNSENRSFFTRIIKLSSTGNQSYYKDFNFKWGNSMSGFCSTYDNGIAFIGLKMEKEKSDSLELSLIKISNEHLYKSGYSNFFKIEPLTSSINSISVEHIFTITPNPANDKLDVSILANIQSEMTLELVSSEGQIVFSNKLLSSSDKQQLEINTSPFSNGLYLLRLITSYSTFTKKVIIIK